MSEITGIGASIKVSPFGHFEISCLAPAGNARHNLQVGDRIISIGSVTTMGKTVDEVKALILGRACSTISLVCSIAVNVNLIAIDTSMLQPCRSSLVAPFTCPFLSHATLLLHQFLIRPQILTPQSLKLPALHQLQLPLKHLLQPPPPVPALSLVCLSNHLNVAAVRS
jgi:hypothetical protein